MSDTEPFSFPKICDDDIAWACKVMGLPEGAFDETRTFALKSPESIDIAACPGSGKTTLLVAKLAILARKWPYRRRGICVLSHTNVARREIEERLGNTAEGQKLLSYPHFIGTIHGFVNEFFGLPGLRFEGHHIAVIDDALCEKRRRGLLTQPRFGALSTWITNKEKPSQFNPHPNNIVKNLFVASADFAVENKNGEAPFKDASGPSARQLKALVKLVVEDGFHRYDEPLRTWAPNLLNAFPHLLPALRHRFPILFIDEAQDNSELQSSILHRVFWEGDKPIVRQRFGDGNQAIYRSAYDNEGARTDPFPAPAIRHDIHNSHRFGERIAAFADPLSVDPQGLAGVGPDQRKVSAQVDDKHAIFLFDGGACDQVLPTFSRYLGEVFNEDALRKGSFVAVGAVHKRPDDDTKKPRSVCDYWTEYEPELSKSEPRPKTFVEYLWAGRAKVDADNSNAASHVVESMAEGVLWGARTAGANLARRRRKHRYVRELLIENEDALANFTELVRRLAVDKEAYCQQCWDEEWKDKVRDVIGALPDNSLDLEKLEDFLSWPESTAPTATPATQKSNFFREPQTNASLVVPKIRVGTVHSVKGETHTSVLIVETYNQVHQMSRLKNWLLGKEGTEIQRNSESARLKLQYVAMTRPTHLLCLAIPGETFADDDRHNLIRLGWQVATLSKDGNCHWLPPGPQGELF